MLSQYSHETKINFKEIECPVKSFLPCGIDIGYSAIKLQSPYNYSVIPSLVYKVSKDNALLIEDTDIRYKDEAGNVWYAGSLAKRALRKDNTTIKQTTLLTRQRMQSEEFLVQIRIAMFVSKLKELTPTAYNVDERPLKIQTGLPAEFMSDSNALKSRFIGTHKFSIKIGNRQWFDVLMNVGNNDISVCKQPFGTLMNCCVNDQGVMFDEDFLRKTILILDSGFHTTDTFCFIQGADEGDALTWENLAMQEVYQRTCADIAKNTNNKADISVFVLEKSLGDGYVYYGPKKEKYEFVHDFEENLREVCQDLIKQLMTTYNNMLDIDTIVLTGGTGAAWHTFFKEYFKDLNTEVIIANDGESAFANVKGYYNFLILKLL